MKLEMASSGYPARWQASGRRAREVIPAAMRAEVRMRASAHSRFIRTIFSREGRHHKRARRAHGSGLTTGVTETRTRTRLPGSYGIRER